MVRVDYGTLNVTIYHSSSCCFVIALGDCYKWISGRLFGPMTKDFGCDVYLFTPRPISCYRDSSYFSQGQNENTKHNIASTPSIYLPSRHPSRLPDTHVCLTEARLSCLIYTSLGKATLIFPQGPWDDASWLRAFCRLYTASLE